MRDSFRDLKPGELLYEGKAKKVFLTNEPHRLIQVFKDDATAFNAKKRGVIKEKGIFNNKISERLFRILEKEGIPTHFISQVLKCLLNGSSFRIQYLFF